jgi:hypothetical protein
VIFKFLFNDQVEEESSEILKRIDPEDLGIAVDAHGNQTVVVTSVQGNPAPFPGMQPL